MVKRFADRLSRCVAFGAALSLILAGLLLGSERANAQPTLIQVGPHYPQRTNIEEPFINLWHAAQNVWGTRSGMTNELVTEGYVSAAGYPQRWPGDRMDFGGFFLANDKHEEAQAHWDGDWVLLWGPAKCADMKIGWDSNGVGVKSPGRIEFTRDYKKNKLLGIIMHVTSLDCPLTELALIRAENEEAYRQGKIYNPRFVEAMSGYDVIRTMDLQQAGTAVVTGPDDLPGTGDLFWAEHSWADGGLSATRPPLYESMPLNAVVALGVESGKALWINAPLTLGAPQRLWDVKSDALKKGDGPWSKAYRAMASQHADEILASPAWDAYADALVAALAEEGYPEERMLYVTVGNEVWNWSRQYFLGTDYAWGVSQGLSAVAKARGRGDRVGYGALLSRMKLALDAALLRAGRDQKVTYVMEGQVGWATTVHALNGAKAWMEGQGENWDDHAPGIGASVASYWYGKWEEFLPKEEWAGAIARDPEGVARGFADFLLTSNTNGGKEYNLRNYRDLKRRAEAYGVSPIGFYEGGSHLKRPRFIDEAWYEAFLWGPEGARVNYEINLALAEAFPGIILSNYVLAGPVGAGPFAEGPLGTDTPYAASWMQVMEAAGRAQGPAQP